MTGWSVVRGIRWRSGETDFRAKASILPANCRDRHVGGDSAASRYSQRHQVREWTRARFSLPEDAAIMVAEVTCAVPGCPPLETLVAFWTPKGRHHFKVFKPLAKVAADDLPPAFLKDALADIEGFGCECC